MKKFNTKEAKDNFGELIDIAQQEPVEIQKNGRPVAVVVSLDEYRRLESIEESWWANEAEKALSDSMFGQKESEDFLKRLLNVKD